MNCDQPYVSIDGPWGEVSIPLDQWIKHGPRFRIFLAPYKLECEDGEEKSVGEIPLQYRNVTLSRFLIAIGILQYPWSDHFLEDSEIFLNLPTIEASQGFAGQIQIFRHRYRTEVNIEVNVRNIELLFPKTWDISICTIWTDTTILGIIGSSKDEQSIETINIQGTKVEGVFHIQALNGSIDSLDELLEDLSPTGEFTIIQNEISEENKSLPHLSYLAVSQEHKLSLGVIVIELDRAMNHISTWLEIFIISPLVNSDLPSLIYQQIMQNIQITEK